MELTSTSAVDQNRPVQRWEPVQPNLCRKLGDARLQFHHAAQFATGAGISYLPPQPDDSHTNLEWLPEFRALFSREIPATNPFRVGVRPAPFALLVLPLAEAPIAALDLHGCTIAEATSWIRDRIEALGVDSSRFTLKRHYEIPSHPVAQGRAFDSSDQMVFDELGKWFTNGFAVLNDLVRRTPQSSEVRCWPHHFDVGTLIRVGSARSVGVGLEPGDEYYDEPYFYVNMTPQTSPQRISSRQLAGSGSWHTIQWIGAVLPGSRLDNRASQNSQVREFLDSAVSAAQEIVGSD